MIKLRSAALFSIALALFCHAPSYAQLHEESLLNQKIEVNYANATLIYVLNKLAVEKRIPIGLEKSSAEKYEAKLNIDIKDGTLKDVLDAIAQQEPAYKWEVKDGVINFTPVNRRYDFVEKLLDTPVNHFAPRKGIGKFEIRDAILDLVEVQNLLTSCRTGIEKYYYPSRRSIYSNDEVDLSISNTNVRGVLNKVARDSEHKIWVVEMYGDEKNKLLISF
jgi:hypothetical protein